MGGVADVVAHHRLIGLDTSIFIYLIEGSPLFQEPAKAALTSLENGEFIGITSVLTLMEVGVQPLARGRLDILAKYEALIDAYANLHIVGIDRDIAGRAASLRAAHRLRPADALQIAACIHHGATAFVTNDKRLRGVTELEIVLLEDLL